MSGTTLTGAATAVAVDHARRLDVAAPAASRAAIVATTAFVSVALLVLAAPFELTEPLLRLPRQSVSSLEAILLVAFAGWGAALAFNRLVTTRRLQPPSDDERWARESSLLERGTPLTQPWMVLLLAMLVASVASPVSRVNAIHMTGRLAAALGVYVLTVNGITTRARLRVVLALSLAVGVAVSALVILEYIGVRPVLTWLELFRPNVSSVGAQVRAGGPLQYPTIASMYLEVVFAFGLGALLGELDRSTHATRTVRVAAVFVALVVVGEAITLTFTRAGLLTMASSLALVGAIRHAQRGTEIGGILVASLALVIAALFLASRSPQSIWLRLTSEGQESWYRAVVDAPRELELPTGRTTTVAVKVANTGRLRWDSRADPPFLLSYHWLPAEGDHFVSFEGVRTPFASPVAPDTTVSMYAVVRAPRQPGRYRLEWDVVQEGRLWFSTEPGAVRQMSRATVTADARWSGVEPTTIMPPPRPTVRPGRLVLWRAAWRMFAAHPLLGVGPDNFRLSYGAYAGLATPDPRTHSNNMYLEMLAGGGLLVGAAFLWLLWRAAGCFVAVARLAPETAGVAPGIAAAGLAIGVHATVDSFLSFAPIYVLFSLTLGCAVACARLTAMSSRTLEARPDAHRV